MKGLLLLAVCLVLGVVGAGGAGVRMSDEGKASGVLFEQLPTGEKFAVYVPRGEAPKGGWPCIVFLNGSGECGTDGQRQLTQGLLPAALNKPEDWPFVIVFPQKPTQKSKWLEHKAMVMACLDQAKGKWSVDQRRVYLTGLSQGGCGTWEIAAASPGVFAAVAPVCGFGDPAKVAPGVGSTPVWAFHGEKDDVVKPEQTRAMVGAIAAARGVKAEELQKDDGKAGALRMTIYPDLNHGCWDRAYRDSGMGAWLLRFELGK
jgi:predicted peptidase